MVGSQHQNHLQEPAGVGGESSAEPEQRHDAADTDILLEDVGNRHSGVQELLATVVRDGGDKGGGFTDEAQLLGPRIVDGNLGGHGLGLRLDGFLLDKTLVHGFEDGG